MATSSPEPAPVPEAPSAIGPLAAEDAALVLAAHARLAPVRRADVLATVNGWTFAGCAVLCLAFALIDPAALLVAVGLALVARTELRCRQLLRIPDTRGLWRLAANQLALLVLVVAYCVWRIWAGLSGPSPSEVPELKPYLERAPANVSEALDSLQRMLVIGLYGALLVTSVLYQGGCALFYLAQRKPIERYLAETPDWVREFERKLGAVA